MMIILSNLNKALKSPMTSRISRELDLPPMQVDFNLATAVPTKLRIKLCMDIGRQQSTAYKVSVAFRWGTDHHTGLSGIVLRVLPVD